MASHGEHCACSAHGPASPSVHQTLDEMEFERGIWSAALDGDVERVRSFLGKGTEPNALDRAGYTALHYASRGGHRAVCQLLLDGGARPDPRTPGGATPLHRAAFCGHAGTVRLLLDRAADPLLKDDDGSTALHKAAEQAQLEVCELLVRRCPELRTLTDKRSRLPSDMAPGNATLQQLLSQD